MAVPRLDWGYIYDCERTWLCLVYSCSSTNYCGQTRSCPWTIIIRSDIIRCKKLMKVIRKESIASCHLIPRNIIAMSFSCFWRKEVYVRRGLQKQKVKSYCWELVLCSSREVERTTSIDYDVWSCCHGWESYAHSLHCSKPEDQCGGIFKDSGEISLTLD